MAQITSAQLGAINNGLTMAFNSQLYAAESSFREFTFEGTSDGAEEVYPRLDMLKGIREWIGARQAQSLTQTTFTIKNRKFEQTIEIAREDIEDDKYGIYAPVAGEMGRQAAVYPDLLMGQLLKSGTTTPWYDGADFFSTEHPSWDANGVATTASNYTAGSYPGWYLIDNTRLLKPFIYQNRVPFDLVARFNPEDPNVFDNDAFLWGTRGRCNVGFGIWQLCYFSQAELTPANLVAARTAMAGYRRPDGEPMGIKPNLLVVPSTLYPQSKSYYENGLVANDPSDPVTLTENTVRNMFKPLEFPWID